MTLRRAVSLALACWDALFFGAPALADCMTRGCLVAAVLSGQCSKLNPSCTTGYTRYVNSVTGSNSNSGRDFAHPLADVTSLPALTAGQSVCLEGGSYWRQQLTTAAANPTIAGCGPGAKPILDASDPIANATFVADGSGGYCTSAPVVFTMGALSAWANIWETGGPGDSATGQFLAYKTTQAAMDAAAGSYFIAGLTTSNMPTSAVICVHATDSSNVVANGYLYEVSQRTGLSMSGGGAVFNIEGRKNANNNGSVELLGDGNIYIVNGIIARDGGKHNLYASGGSSVVNSTIIDGYYPTGDGMIVFNDNVGADRPIAANNDIFQQDQLIAGNGTAIGIFGHTNTSGALGPLAMNNDWFIAKNGAVLDAENFNTGNVGAITANNDVGSQLSIAFLIGSNLTVSNSQFVSDQPGNIFISDAVGGLTHSVAASKVCATHLSGSQGMLFINSASAGDAVTLTNNLFFLGAISTGNATLDSNAGKTNAWTVNGNDFGSTFSNWFVLGDSNTSSTFVGDNNIYENSSVAVHWSWHGSFPATLAAWKALPTIVGQDTHSTQAGGNAVSACTLPTLPVVN